MGRWYPTACTLENGEVLVVSGSGTLGDGSAMNALPQVWKKGGGWRDLKDAKMIMGYYPWMLSAPDGKVFWAGPQRQTRYLETSGTGKWYDGPASSIWLRDYGSAVLYEPGKVLIVGGGDPPTKTAETIDLNPTHPPTKPQWHETGKMAFARRQLNATVLPDGKVLVTGGTEASGFNNETGGVLATEVWDPATGQWTTLAAMKVPRLYHSTALLLPDGTVLSAGGGMAKDENERPYTHYPNAQIYSPPYLFKGPRPVITSAPEILSYGASFGVKTPDAAKIQKVTLIRLGSVTHAFDQSQRFALLPFLATADGLTVNAPADSKVCPPGPYLLFLVDQAGVPSVGRIVSLPG
ncbi:MAG TPA: galactose oxidase-like domain-containing protein [Thermoanaerobaculia bacterium]|nr:galactose oxidase-like domain-containing protein [Thermoanaerobaculia bacterium]